MTFSLINYDKQITLNNSQHSYEEFDGFPVVYYKAAYNQIKFLDLHVIQLICRHFGFKGGRISDDAEMAYFKDQAPVGALDHVYKFIAYLNCSKNETVITNCRITDQ